MRRFCSILRLLALLLFICISLTACGNHTVRFYDASGNLLSTETVRDGNYASAPEPPEMQGYSFISWSENLYSVTEDLEVYPCYEPWDVYESLAFFLQHHSALSVENVHTVKVSFDEAVGILLTYSGELGNFTLTIPQVNSSYLFVYEKVYDADGTSSQSVDAETGQVENSLYVTGSVQAAVFAGGGSGIIFDYVGNETASVTDATAQANCQQLLTQTILEAETLLQPEGFSLSEFGFTTILGSES